MGRLTKACFTAADILIPKVSDMQAWSVIACDQFTSEPEYWSEVYKRVGDKPSSLRLILPEALLSQKDTDSERSKIYDTMRTYLDEGIFEKLENSYVYVERTLSSGAVRKGIVGALDLEAYDWAPGSELPVRATEDTVEDRLPPRIKIRRKALLEMPHILIFVNDPENSLISSIKKGKALYDFELMQNGGRVSGWQAADNCAVDAALEHLFETSSAKGEDPLFMAIGDGNHSVAAAKKYWDEIKKALSPEERATHPARYALAELVNIHDQAIDFKPIHRLIYGTDTKTFFDELKARFAAADDAKTAVKCFSGGNSIEIGFDRMTYGEIIADCEAFCKEYAAKHDGHLDYIHGDAECIKMSQKDGCCCLLMPQIPKEGLFETVVKSGAFPRKSFSIGNAEDKRYYLECRRIK